ncbi:MAG: GNAT family N-acetyltransferase [Blastocatellia bacterium]
MIEQIESSKTLYFRAATVADAEQLAEVATSTFHQAFDGSTRQENVDEYIQAAFNPAQLAAELAEANSTYVLVESAGRAIGYCKLYAGEVPECVGDDGALEISRLYVRQEFWAQKVGAALMQWAMDEARRKGCETIFLGVWEHNERAKAFYHRWGFARVGEHIFQMGDDPQTDWWMARKL